MFSRLLESRRAGKHSVWGAVLSTVAHTGAIALAVFATAQARVDDPPAAPEIIRWIKPPLSQPASSPAPVAPPKPPDRRISTPTRTSLVIDRIDLVIPAVDVTPWAPEPSAAPISGEATDSQPVLANDGMGSNEPFTGDQVERQVYLRPGSSAPRYPSALRAAGIEGTVIALFVVSEAGRVELETVRFSQSDNPLFEDAVRSALDRMRFVPAEVGGRKVRQLVQMPFVFTLTR